MHKTQKNSHYKCVLVLEHHTYFSHRHYHHYGDNFFLNGILVGYRKKSTNRDRNFLLFFIGTYWNEMKSDNCQFVIWKKKHIGLVVTKSSFTYFFILPLIYFLYFFFDAKKEWCSDNAWKMLCRRKKKQNF